MQRKANKTTEKLIIFITTATVKVTKLSPLLIHFRYNNEIWLKLLFLAKIIVLNKQLYISSTGIILFVHFMISLGQRSAKMIRTYIKKYIYIWREIQRSQSYERMINDNVNFTRL